MMIEQIIRVQKWPYPEPPTEERLREIFQSEGLIPHRWTNGPGNVYQAHTHSYRKIVYVVAGSITFGFPIESDPTTLDAGDRLDLPAGVLHNAAVGEQGVICLEAHRI